MKAKSVYVIFDRPEDCADHAKNHYCFAAGDKRCNEQPELT